MQIDWFPLWLSLRVAVFSTLIALLAGLWIAYLLANRRFRGKDILDALVTLPLVLPPTVLGYYLLVLLGRESHLGRVYEWITGSPLVFTWQAAVVAALFPALPLLVKPARAAFESLDRSYGRAARSLGASEWRVFWRVTLPLAWRSVAGGLRTGFRPFAWRIRRHHYDCGQHSAQDADPVGGHLRRPSNPTMALLPARW